jgi:hypothetical protein
MTSEARNGGCGVSGARRATTDVAWLLSHPTAMKGGGDQERRLRRLGETTGTNNRGNHSHEKKAAAATNGGGGEQGNELRGDGLGKGCRVYTEENRKFATITHAPLPKIEPYYIPPLVYRKRAPNGTLLFKAKSLIAKLSIAHMSEISTSSHSIFSNIRSKINSPHQLHLYFLSFSLLHLSPMHSLCLKVKMSSL